MWLTLRCAVSSRGEAGVKIAATPSAWQTQGRGAFGDRLLGGPTPWSRLRQAQKVVRLGERYTPARLNAACRRAVEVDLIDVRRLERILVEALGGGSHPGDRRGDHAAGPLCPTG